MCNQDAAMVLLGAAGPGNFGLPFDLGQFVGILKLGSIGLAFVLALFLVYLLVKLKQAPAGTSIPSGWIYATLVAFVVIFAFYLVAQHFDESKILRVDHDKQMKEQKDQYDKQMQAQKDNYEDIIETMTKPHLISGKISKPKEGDTPERTAIDCAGTVSRFHRESGLHLWLAVEANGFLWPKEPELDVRPNGEWAARIFQDGPESPFSLCLIVVDKETNENIQKWISERIFNKMAWPKGALRLDRVDGLRRKDKP